MSAGTPKYGMCGCGRPMYLVGYGAGVLACRECDDHPDLPPPEGAWWATGSEWDYRYPPLGDTG